MRDNKKQHYIPQYYLKNFSINEHIHIYDLKIKQSYTNSIKNTAYKKYFYNVDTNFFKKIIEDEVFENEDFIDKLINEHNESILAAFFDSFNPTRERILKKDKRETISIIDFHSLVDFVLMQTYRNPKLQIFFGKIQEEINIILQEKSSTKFDNIARGIVILLLLNELHYGRKTKLKEVITNNYSDIINEIKMWKELITNAYKFVYWNMTDIDFLTSDCTMSYIRLIPEKHFTSIFIPINTKIAVLLVNKMSPTFDSRIKNNGTILKIEDKSEIKNYNQKIIESANRFVYSINGNFPDEIKSVKYKEWWNKD